jgi:hypothetical protein
LLAGVDIAAEDDFAALRIDFDIRQRGAAGDNVFQLFAERARDLSSLRGGILKGDPLPRPDDTILGPAALAAK